MSARALKIIGLLVLIVVVSSGVYSFIDNGEEPFLTDEEERNLRNMYLYYSNEFSFEDHDTRIAEMKILDTYVEDVLSGERRPYRFNYVQTIINYTLTLEEAEKYNIQNGSHPFTFYQTIIHHGDRVLGSASERSVYDKLQESRNFFSVEHIDRASFTYRYNEIKIELWVYHLYTNGRGRIDSENNRV